MRKGVINNGNTPMTADTETREEIADKLTKVWTEMVEVCEQRLSVQILLGQGFLCVLERDGMMGIGNTEDGKGYRLHILNGWLTGILHYARADADTLAKHWNGNLTGDAALYCRVKVMHRREVLEHLRDTAQKHLEWLKNGFPKAPEA